MSKKHSPHSRSPRPSLTWRPIFMPRDEFDEILRESLVVDTATMEHASDLAGLLGMTVVDVLELLMRIGVLLSAENIPVGCRFCSGTGIEILDNVDIYGNHSNYEVKCRHCLSKENIPPRASDEEETG